MYRPEELRPVERGTTELWNWNNDPVEIGPANPIRSHIRLALADHSCAGKHGHAARDAANASDLA